MNIIQDIDLLKFEALQQSQSIRPASDFMEEAMERLERGVKIYGDPMPWQKTHDDFRFREGEVTIWAGVNGQGKSLVMGQTVSEEKKGFDCFNGNAWFCNCGKNAETGIRHGEAYTGFHG